MKIQGLCFPVMVFALRAAQAAEVPWETIDETDGIVSFAREIPGTSVLAMKGEGIVDAPLEKVASVILDHPRSPDWVSDLEMIKILRWTGPMEYIEYSHFRTPIVMKDREFVSRVNLSWDPAKKVFLFLFNAVEDPSAPKTSYVRGALKDTKFILRAVEKDGKQATHFTGEVWCDPAGSVPKWIVNLFQRGWPLNTLRGMRRRATASDAIVMPKVKEILGLK